MAVNISRSHRTHIAIACILSVGLITAAIADSYRFRVSPMDVMGVIYVEPRPPISQDSVRQQFEAQALAQAVDPLEINGNEFVFKGVTVKQVTYSAESDSFTVFFKALWQKTDGEMMDYDRTGTLYNDGYGHYYCTPSGNESETERGLYVTIK